MTINFLETKDHITLIQAVQLLNKDNIECKSHPDLYSLGLQSVLLPGKTEEFEIADSFEYPHPQNNRIPFSHGKHFLRF